jgi:3-oxoacyl-[acyl-carrier-protein] synthase-3
MNAELKALTYYLPQGREENQHLAHLHPGRTTAEMSERTGIRERAVSARNEIASDLGLAAATKLLDVEDIERESIDFLLLCTCSPDYFFPSTSCILQHRLGLRRDIGALDINLGCSGYVYSMSVAKSLVETGQAQNVLLITAETYSKYCAEDDRSTRLLFGDGASASLIRAAAVDEVSGADIGPFVFGTDGGGAELLFVHNGAFREVAETCQKIDQETTRKAVSMYMDGPKMFAFATSAVPEAVQALLKRASLSVSDVDVFIFHQASAYILQRIAHALRIPSDKVLISMDDCGNTGASSIPIVLSRAISAGTVQAGTRVVLVGFGTGLSWAATVLRWK